MMPLLGSQLRIRWSTSSRFRSQRAALRIDALKNKGIFAGIDLKRRLLLHLTLKGNFAYGEGKPELNVDGEAFGVMADDGVLDVKLPSGDGRRGGDPRDVVLARVVPTLGTQLGIVLREVARLSDGAATRF